MRVRTGSVRNLIGPVRFGPDLIGPVRFGPDRIASDRTNLNQSGSVRSGSVRTGPYYVPHIIITYNDHVDMDILCYRTTGTYPCIVLLLDYIYKVLDGVE